MEQIKPLSALTVLPCTKNCKIVQFIEFQKHSGLSLRPINNNFFNIIINIINSNNNSMKYLASVLFTAKSKSIKSQLQLIKVGHLGKLKI